jgi:biopolymer transport protein ExbD
MARRTRNRKRRPEVGVPLTSMGDIAFLLIIFLVIASNFIQARPKNLETPTTPVLDEVEQGVALVTMDNEGKIALDGRLVGSAKVLEAQLRGRISNQTSERGRRVLLQVDKEMTKASFEPVIEAIVKSNGIVAFVGREEADVTSVITEIHVESLR